MGVNRESVNFSGRGNVVQTNDPSNTAYASFSTIPYGWACLLNAPGRNASGEC